MFGLGSAQKHKIWKETGRVRELECNLYESDPDFF